MIGSLLSESKVETKNRMSKINRNDPCPCGSGKKYKKCCGLREDAGKKNRLGGAKPVTFNPAQTKKPVLEHGTAGV